MNKNKLIVLLVLLIAVVGLAVGPVSAKIIKVDVKNKVTSKKVGKYALAAKKQKYDSKTYLVILAVAKKNKALKGNKYKSKVYYKYKGKNYSTKWSKGYGNQQKKQNYQLYVVPTKIKVKKIAVKV